MAKIKIYGNYDWKKTVKKFVYGFVYVIICGLLYLATDKTEVAVLLPLLMAAQNFFKHKLSVRWL
jgi:hypothetical protein